MRRKIFCIIDHHRNSYHGGGLAYAMYAASANVEIVWIGAITIAIAIVASATIGLRITAGNIFDIAVRQVLLPYQSHLWP